MLNANQFLLNRAAFDEVLREHADLIRLANELEFNLYELGDQGPPDREKTTTCQQSAGELIRRLRAMLFRLDQQVYPIMDPGYSDVKNDTGI